MSLRSWWESRAADTPTDYTSLRIAQGVERVSGEQGARGTAVYAACRGLWARAAAATTLEGEHSEALRARLPEIARGLVDTGEATYELRLGPDGLTLIPCSIATVYGASDPKEWRYLLTRHGPTETASIEREAAGVLSFRINASSRTPWRGCGLLAASGTGQLLAELEEQLSREAKVKPTRIVTSGGVARQAVEVENSLKRGGLVSLVQGQVFGRDDPSGVKAGVVRNETPQASVNLYTELERAVAAACGVPYGLIFSDGDGAAARENFRFFAASTIAPILGVVQTEWQAKVAPLKFSLDELRASDTTARARALGSRSAALKNLVGAGVPVERALEIAGLSE